jgi:hypothetical protein
MDVPCESWGRRLGDTVRDALRQGRFGDARRLAVDGDGQSRSLATEYAYMMRGLSITIALLLRLLGESATRACAPQATHALEALVFGLRCGLEQLRHEPQTALEAELRLAAQAVAANRDRFEREQHARADTVIEAIERRDASRALALLQARDDAYLTLHDALVRFMADAFGWTLEHLGADGLLALHLETAEGQRAGFEKWERMLAAEFARTSAFLLKQHMGKVEVAEDDERFTIVQRPCGSGGRLIRAGAYAGADALPFVETPGPLTFGRPRLPVYCSHCAIWNGAATLRWFGRAQWVFDDPARGDGGCTLHVYKRHDATPPDYAARVGLPGPAADVDRPRRLRGGQGEP